MKAVILAGGLGTRMAEATEATPKPMVQIGGKPILWHIMKFYASFGVNDFIICLGYRGYVIKEYFSNYALHTSDVTFDLGANAMSVHSRRTEDWTVTLVDTGETTQTGGRLKRVAPYLGRSEPFYFTYGDGLSDVSISAETDFHRSEGRLATMLAVRPPGRFGSVQLAGSRVEHFQEKPAGDGGYINGGFFILEPECLDFVAGDSTSWENEPLNTLAEMQQLSAFVHDGFWQPMDTTRERDALHDLWTSGRAPWRRGDPDF